MKSRAMLLSTLLLFACATGRDFEVIGENAYRVTTVDNTEAEAARVAINQADLYCAKMGKAPVYSSSRQNNDMPARHILTMEFQCTSRGSSPQAQAETQMLELRRDCSIAGYPLGSPENIKCAADIAAKSRPKAAPSR